MPSKNRRKTPLTKNQTQNRIIKEPDLLFEGERLNKFLNSFRKQIEIHRNLDKSLSEKLWTKQQFAVGVNEVTRILQRMPLSSSESKDVSSPKLQALIVASDCSPRWLTTHFPGLAGSRNVPVIYVKDCKQGSLRLGEIVKVKTAVVLGIKAKGSVVNEFVRRIVDGNGDGLMKTAELETAMDL